MAHVENLLRQCRASVAPRRSILRFVIRPIFTLTPSSMTNDRATIARQVFHIVAVLFMPGLPEARGRRRTGARRW